MDKNLFIGREYEIRQLQRYRDFKVTGLYKKPKKIQLKNFYLALLEYGAQQNDLMPFTLQETEKYLISRGIHWSRYDIVECYMTMGGIPYYLKLLDNELSYLTNIDTIFFKSKGPLWDEFDHLYEALFGNAKWLSENYRCACLKKNWPAGQNDKHL